MPGTDTDVPRHQAGSIQCAAMAVEDGAVLGKLFSHISSERQIAPLLYAFQEVRQPRTRSVRVHDMHDLQNMLLPDGPEQATRDARMQALTRAGKNVLEELDGDEKAGQLWETLCRIFGYDCEDEADNWWVQWGMLRERAFQEQGDECAEEGGEKEAAPPIFNFSRMSVLITSTQSSEDKDQ